MCWDELAAVAYYAGDMLGGLNASNKLLEDKKFPEEHKDRIVGNFQQYAQWLTEQEQGRMAIEQEKMKEEVKERAKGPKKAQSRRKKAKSR